MANYEKLRFEAQVADQHDYVLVWPHGRGAVEGGPIGVTDIFEAMAEVMREYHIDRERIYLAAFAQAGGTR